MPVKKGEFRSVKSHEKTEMNSSFAPPPSPPYLPPTGCTPRDYAEKNGLTEVLELLDEINEQQG